MYNNIQKVDRNFLAISFLTVYLKDIIRGVFKRKKKKKDVFPGAFFMVLSRIGNNGK